jgi:phosphohistidine phosphatase
MGKVKESNMRIYLVQHGQAKSEDIDTERHLTGKGIVDVREISDFIKDIGLQVDVIWHSGKARAAQTAEILATSIVTAQGVIQRDGLAPNDDVRPIKNELSLKSTDVMIVGHLPFLSKLASSLLVGDESVSIIGFQQGGLVCLERNEAKLWIVRWMLMPDLIL